MIDSKDGWKVFICIVIAIILSVWIISPQKKLDEAWEARRLVREESTLVYSGTIIKARGMPWGPFLTYRWWLTFEDGHHVGITKSRYWLVPIGEKIDVYKYVDESRRGGKLYFIKRRIDREKKEK